MNELAFPYYEQKYDTELTNLKKSQTFFNEN